MTPDRLDGVDGLRALAASGVVLFHVWLYSSPGGTVSVGPIDRLAPLLASGLTLFFALSGFLLYRPFAAAILRGERLPSVGRYARNRALRIVPAYWVVLLAVAVVLPAALVWTAEGSLALASLRGEPRLLLRSAFLVQSFRPDSLLTGIGPAWTLSVELAFYALLPLLAAVAARLAGARRLAAALAPAGVLLATGLAGKAVVTLVLSPSGIGSTPGWSPDWHSVASRSFLAHADLFSFGMAVAVLHAGAGAGLWRIRPAHWRGIAAATVGIAGAAVALRTLRILPHAPYDTAMAAACALGIATVTVRPEGVGAGLVRVLGWKPLVAVGLCSYSLYLWHEPLIRLLTRLGWTRAGVWGLPANVVLVAVVAGTLSWATYVLVERPALRRKRAGVGAPLPTGAPP